MLLLITLQLNQSDAHRVVLRDLQPSHTGKYRCEVSGDSPSFTTITVAAYLYVASKYHNISFMLEIIKIIRFLIIL